jgi:hypothetical protein
VRALDRGLEVKIVHCRCPYLPARGLALQTKRQGRARH